MIRPGFNAILSKATENTLETLQQEIDSIKLFPQKAEKAKNLWSDKESTIEKRKAFAEVKHKLTKMSVSVGICNYCEHNEGGDIEHIAPKSFFPEKTFVWDNYLLACKTCNSGYKLDQCFVLDNSGNTVSVPRKNEPPFKELAFINPRIEDPNRFMILNTQSFMFRLKPGLSKMEQNKAEKTIDILKLNERDVLKKARESAADYFYKSIDQLIRILNSNTVEELKKLLSPYDKYYDSSLSLHQNKLKI
ncbi:MAG TPA: hypothetical protein PKH79_13315, partial [Prolixibacteraceae bacterium]|nr:hypothetical protein [Prolixibacteraceae bacterium]